METYRDFNNRICSFARIDQRSVCDRLDGMFDSLRVPKSSLVVFILLVGIYVLLRLSRDVSVQPRIDQRQRFAR